MKSISKFTKAISIFLVVPFYNEKNNLPILFKSFNSCLGGLDDVGILGVNHNSKDNSDFIFKNLSKKFGYVEMVNENSAIPSVGIPRKTGLDRAFEYANIKKNGRKVIIGSLDADARVHPMFFEEARRFILSDNNLLVFSSRHQQDLLNKVILSQKPESRDMAITSILGIEWLRFQFREVLYFINVNETRCSAGVFLTPFAYKKIGGHMQFFNDEKRPITGEANAMGIRANKKGLSIGVSSYLTELNPRRYLKAISGKMDTLGYMKDKNESKIFVRSSDEFEIPYLNNDEFSKFRKKSIKDDIGATLMRAACFNKLSELAKVFQYSAWSELVKLYSLILDERIHDDEIYNITGHGEFSNVFKSACSKIGNEKIELLIKHFSDKIPDNNQLINWSEKEIHHPSLEIV